MKVLLTNTSIIHFSGAVSLQQFVIALLNCILAHGIRHKLCLFYKVRYFLHS